MLEPAFLDGARGRIHCTFFRPATGTGPGLLFLPPFAEEMNKSRRMMAQFGHQLAERGWMLALPDPFGTGDSEGDFGDTDWEGWRRDVVAAASALLERGAERLVLAGLRTGALLGLDSLAELPRSPERLLLWQPVVNGQQFLTRFLRLRVAAAMARGEREPTSELRARLQAGEPVEIAGYQLSPAMARALDTLDATLLAPPANVPVDWLEVSGGEEVAVSSAGQRMIDAWRDAGCSVEAEAVSGDAFWGTQEIVDVPALWDRSLNRLMSKSSKGPR